MNPLHSHQTAWIAFALAAALLAAGPRSVPAESSDKHSHAMADHSHPAEQPLPRLQPKRVISVTGKEDWDAQRGFGNDSAMAEMMTLMMVAGSGMEHMKMPPMKRSGSASAGGRMDMRPTGTSATGGPQVMLNSPAETLKVGKNTLVFSLRDASGQPISGAKVTTSVAMTSMDMGTAHPPVREDKAGQYTTVVEFSMKGPWRVTLTAAMPGGKQVTRSFEFNVKE